MQGVLSVRPKVLFVEAPEVLRIRWCWEGMSVSHLAPVRDGDSGVCPILYSSIRRLLLRLLAGDHTFDHTGDHGQPYCLLLWSCAAGADVRAKGWSLRFEF